MAIAFDAVTTATSTLATYSWTHTCTGSDLILIVGVAIIDSGGGGPATVTGITYNSVALTKIRARAGANANNAELWQLVTPAAGANSVAVTLNQAPAQASMSGAISLTGVNQVSPVDAQNDDTSATGQPTVSVTTVADNTWVINVVSDNNDDTATAASAQTLRWTKNNAGADRMGAGSTTGPVTPAGATTMNWTGWTSAWVSVVASLKPVSAPAAAADTAFASPIFRSRMREW